MRCRPQRLKVQSAKVQAVSEARGCVGGSQPHPQAENDVNRVSLM